MIFIGNFLTPDEKKKASEFLDRIKPLLATNDYEIQESSKNSDTDRMYSLRDKDKKEILKSLTVEDCIEITANTNSRFENSELFIFAKDADVYILGEREIVEFYIKLYVKEYPNFDKVIVVSFHKSGMYE